MLPNRYQRWWCSLPAQAGCGNPCRAAAGLGVDRNRSDRARTKPEPSSPTAGIHARGLGVVRNGSYRLGNNFDTFSPLVQAWFWASDFQTGSGLMTLDLIIKQCETKCQIGSTSPERTASSKLASPLLPRQTGSGHPLPYGCTPAPSPPSGGQSLPDFQHPLSPDKFW